MENGEPLNPVEEAENITEEVPNAIISTEENISFKVDEEGMLIQEIAITETEEDPGVEEEGDIEECRGERRR